MASGSHPTPRAFDAQNPRTWGNCIRRSDLPLILNEQCEFYDSSPDQSQCLRAARQWKWMPQGGWFPLCFEHADYIAALDREWNEAEDRYLAADSRD